MDLIGCIGNPSNALNFVQFTHRKREFDNIFYSVESFGKTGHSIKLIDDVRNGTKYVYAMMHQSNGNESKVSSFSIIIFFLDPFFLIARDFFSSRKHRKREKEQKMRRNKMSFIFPV